MKIQAIKILVAATSLQITMGCGPSTKPVNPGSTGQGGEGDPPVIVDPGTQDPSDPELNGPNTEFDSDGDGLSDLLELDLGTDPAAPTPTTLLRGRVLLANGTPAAGASVNLRHPQLSASYAGLGATVQVDGAFSLAQAWPTEVSTGAEISAQGLSAGQLHHASASLPFLIPGPSELPDLYLEAQPLTHGTSFFVAVPHLSGGQISVLAFTNPGSRRARVSWRVPGLPNGTVNGQGEMTLEPGTGRSVSVPSHELTLYSSWHEGVSSLPAGVQVTSDHPITCALQTYRSDRDGMAAFPCLPTSAHGTDFALQTLDHLGGSPFGLVTAATSDAQTTLTFTWTMRYFVGSVPVIIPAGIPHPELIEFQDSVQFTGGDLTGSRVSSAAEVGVVSGNAYVGQTAALEAVASVEQWGRSFVSVGFLGDYESSIQIVAGADGAALRVGNLNYTLQNYQSLRVTLVDNDPITIESDEPVLAWQTFHWSFGGRAAVHLAPTQRWINETVAWAFAAPGMVSRLAIVIPTDAIPALRINGDSFFSLDQVVQAPITSEYTLLIARVDDGSLHIESPEPLFPCVLGTGQATSENYAYGYAAAW